ncbi:MAG: hypothetical protein E2O42_04345 [Nitrospina sp.]|nr:MAG: hypothetical protein E2O43_08235 [Nitrospina sp.]TDJ60542.1 MAG: hypothetical protein E2O42_04345 [Nitrospina sp.]
MKPKNLRLEPGIHEFSLKEIKERYCFNPHRRALFEGLKKAVKIFKSAGVKKIYIAGSFVGDCELPNDIDGCWLCVPSVITKKIDPVLLDLSKGRQKMKDKYGVDFFLANLIESSTGKPFVKFFQTDRDGKRKGIIKIKL